MEVLIYSLGALSRKEGVGSVALNLAENLPYKKAFLSTGKWRKTLFYSFLSPIWFALKVRKIRPGVVLVHTTEACFDPIVARKLFGFDYKIVCVAHGLYFDLTKEYLKEIELGNTTKNRRFLMNLKISNFRSKFINRVDLVVAVSQMVKKSLKKNYGVDSVVINNGLDMAFEKNRPSKRTSIETILFVGNQYWLKGLHYLIRANNLLKSPKKIIAVGIDMEQTEKIKSLEDCSKIEFKGKVSKKQLFNLIKKSDLFVMPSVYESFGLVYLEALSLGVPVIASKGTGAEDIIEEGKNGYLVTKRDVKELTDTIKKAERNIQKLSGKTDLSRFSWKKLGKEYKKVIEGVVK